MRPSLTLLVRPRRPVRDTPPLLPPLQLYRRILRAHAKQLPPDMRYLGDLYVKAEFKLHKDTDNPLYIVGFLTQWQDYLRQLDTGEWAQGKMLKHDFDKMLPEQVHQLYELMQATQLIGEDDDAGDSGPVPVSK